MLSSKLLSTLFLLILLVFTNASILKADCEKQFKHDINEYNRFSVPAEYFWKLTSAPQFNKQTISDENMKNFMKEMPIKRANRIAIFGIVPNEQSQNFKVYFGDETTVSFWFEYVNGSPMYETYDDFMPGNKVKLAKLPMHFVFIFSFTKNGVEVKLHEMPTFELRSKWCLPYRVIGKHISHMALFSKCDGINFHMINLEEYPLSNSLCPNDFVTSYENPQLVIYDPQKSGPKLLLPNGKVFLEPVTGIINGNNTIYIYESNRSIDYEFFKDSMTVYEEC